MIKVTIADVVKQERTDEQGRAHTVHVIVLQDETGKRALPIWIGPGEGASIVMGLSEFAMLRPMTLNLSVSLLQAINARVEEVRVEALKGEIFYAIVRIRCGKSVSEVDARPSDAIALAVHTGSPILVAEDVLENAGADIPETADVSCGRKGVDDILGEVEEMQRQMQSRQSQTMSKEEITIAKAEVIASVFGN